MSKATPKSSAASKVKVTLIRSMAGQLKSHQATVRGLGLRRMHQSAVVSVTPQVQGMLTSAQHMLKIEKA
jgi:large subunit ribosomal protein L30